MAFDECRRIRRRKSGGRRHAHRALGEGQEAHTAIKPSSGSCRAGPLDLREQSAREIVEIAPATPSAASRAAQADMHAAAHLDPVLPRTSRVTSSAWTPEDILEGWRGVTCSTACCPRNARNASSRAPAASPSAAKYRADARPPDELPCYTCRTVSRAYLRHLHLANEMSAATLMTMHNLAFYLDTLRRIGQSIRLGRFNDFRTEMLRQLVAAPEDEAPGPHTP